ncbi:MAG: hypothetical protein V1716_00465 [Candidatus Uhrbacteria bacterium]
MDTQPTNQEILMAVKDLSLVVKQNTVDIKDLSSAVKQNTFDIRDLSSAVKQNIVDIKDLGCTIQDVLEAVSDFSNRTDERFNRIEGDIVGIKSTMVTKDELKAEFAKFETRMVSKDYLDQKLSSFKGDLVEATRGENKKLTATVNLLAVKKVFTKEEATNVLALELVV